MRSTRKEAETGGDREKAMKIEEEMENLHANIDFVQDNIDDCQVTMVRAKECNT